MDQLKVPLIFSDSCDVRVLEFKRPLQVSAGTANACFTSGEQRKGKGNGLLCAEVSDRTPPTRHLSVTSEWATHLQEGGSNMEGNFRQLIPPTTRNLLDMRPFYPCVKRIKSFSNIQDVKDVRSSLTTQARTDNTQQAQTRKQNITGSAKQSPHLCVCPPSSKNINAINPKSYQASVSMPTLVIVGVGRLPFTQESQQHNPCSLLLPDPNN